MFRRLWTTLLALTFLASPALAEDEAVTGLPNQDVVNSRADAFMDKVEEGRVLAAYRSMRDVLGVDSEGFEDRGEEAREFFRQVRERVGDPVGHDRVRVSTIKDHFYRLDYLQKFEAAALAWEFTFYRPKDRWLLVGVKYSTELDRLYQTQ